MGQAGLSMMPRMDRPGGTGTEQYADRLVRLQTARWKRWLDVQAPFRWNLRRLDPGFTLEIGCGIGRNLLHLRGQSVGVDTNAHCVGAARGRGLTAFTPEEFRHDAHHWLILHGRYICQARKPLCPKCIIVDLCEYRRKTKPEELES